MPKRTNGSEPIERSRSVILIPTACQCAPETDFWSFISPLRAMAPMGLQGTAFTRLSLLGPVLAVLDVSFTYACISDHSACYGPRRKFAVQRSQRNSCCSQVLENILPHLDTQFQTLTWHRLTSRGGAKESL